MHVYETRAQFDAELGSVKKWMRTGQALDIVDTLKQGVAYSIGDSLVYWWDRTPALATDDFVGHRRYLTILCPRDAAAAIEVAPKAALEQTEAYSDLTDRERFQGTGDTVTVPAGGILVIDEDEAYRICAAPDAALCVLHVTVEGYSFPNK